MPQLAADFQSEQEAGEKCGLNAPPQAASLARIGSDIAFELLSKLPILLPIPDTRKLLVEGIAKNVAEIVFGRTS